MSYKLIEKANNLLLKETGYVKKDWGGKISVALVYPNTYYVGMSNLGLHVVYRKLNEYTHDIGSPLSYFNSISSHIDIEATSKKATIFTAIA